MVNDPISDLITRIKNAGMAKKKIVSVPHSKMKLSIVNLLKKEGFISSIKEDGKNILIGIGKVNGVKRVSKLSRRQYSSVKDIKKQGRGITVLSTPNGILSDKEAIEKKVGGEVLFKIW